MTEGNGEVRELPNGWCSAKISELALVDLGKTPKKSYYVNNGKYKIIKFRDVSYSGIEWSHAEQGFVQFDGAQDLRELFEDDVLITSSAHSSEHIGKKIAFVDKIPANFEKIFFVGELLSVRSDQGLVNPKFVFFYFLSRSGYVAIQSKVKGVHLTSGEARKIDIPLAPLYEQQRIVEKIEELFSDLDQGIKSLKTAQKQLKVYRQVVLKSAFEGKLTEKWREQAKQENPDLKTGEELLAEIKAERENRYQQQLAEWEEAVKEWEAISKIGKRPTKPSKLKDVLPLTETELGELPQLPDGWCWVKLGQLTWSVKDGPHYSPQYVENGIPFISGGNVRPEGVDFENVKYITLELHEELSKRCKPELGDVLYTKGGTTGIARVNTYNKEFNVWVHIAVLKIVKSINPFFLQNALNSLLCYAQSQEYTHGVGNQDLGLTRMVNIVL